MLTNVFYDLKKIHNYITRNFYSYECTTALNIALDTGFTELAIYMVQGWGFYPKNETERIISLYPRNEEYVRQLQDQCLKNCIIMTNPKNGGKWWIPNIDDHGIDYLISEKDCIKMGYTEKGIWNNGL